MPAKKTDDIYNPEKRYSIKLKRFVEHEGFSLRPGPNPIEVTGAYANEIADAIDEAHAIVEPVRDDAA